MMFQIVQRPIARHFEVEVVPDARGRTEYEHPVDIMGTNLFSPVDVICLFGKVQPNSIVSNICGMELGHTAIVILNGALSLNDRRQIAEIFHKERSGQNPFTIFGQFGSPLCIKPLSAADSLELLSRPLRYLGFNVDPDQLESFLVNTSFYPGIVHYVGYSLVENLMTRYSEYYQASKNNPPYQLTDKQFGEILSSGKLNEKIDERITWTLEADPRYLELACCIAYLYNNDAENNKNGHSVEMILMAADIFGISDITALKAGAVQGLLDEMVDMGILVRPTLNTYRLRQRRFLDAIGPSDEQIFQRIEEMKHNE